MAFRGFLQGARFMMLHGSSPRRAARCKALKPLGQVTSKPVHESLRGKFCYHRKLPVSREAIKYHNFRCMISFDSLIRYSNLTQFLLFFLSRQLGCPTFFQPLFFTTSHAFCNSGLAGRLCLVSFEVTAVFTARKVLEILKP